MPMDLSNGTSEFGCAQWLWPKLLRLARVHGWRPRGTTLPDDPGGTWDGNYTSNDGQVVGAEDAAALADALEAALPHVPDHDALARYKNADGMIEIAPRHPPAPDAAWFSTPAGKANVAAFIRFCREGAFRIA
jgi:hypothetical protein